MRKMLRKKFKRILAGAVMALASLAIPAQGAPVQGTQAARELNATFNKSVRGKTIAFLPIATGVPLMDEWWRVIRTEAAARGIKTLIRDPNNNPSAMLQALAAVINSRPDVIIVHNQSVTLLVKELKRAEAMGIHVIQMNMASNYMSDAFIGANWEEIGRMLGREVVKECGTKSGKSGKVQIVQGELTAGASIDQIGGLLDELSKDRNIKVVSNQAANWDANNALNITATVIQRHPDLCASVGFWGVMQSGAAQAIRNAGKINQVKIYASGEGSVLDCDQINKGNFTKFLNYKATEQGHDAFTVALALMQSGVKAGTRKMAFYTVPQWMDKSNAGPGRCYPLPKN